MPFVHLHVHTQYSILDGFSAIPKLFQKASEYGMPALSITDHGNMYGVKEFMKVAGKYPDIKPIIGCEVYVTRHYDHTLKDNEHRGYYHLILLAKNYEGYKNLMKIVSTGHIEGKYYDKPRVCHEILEKYHDNLICCSACLAGEIPRNILAGNMDAAREAVKWHKDIFGEDYYLEVQLHKTEVPGLSPEVYEKQLISNEAIFQLSEEFGVKVVASNDVHFVNKEDAPVHDRLICLTTNAFVDDPDRMRYTQQEYLKSEEEMAILFPGHPEVLSNTLEVAEKVERYNIDRDHVLPRFELPQEFLDNIDFYLDKYREIIDEGRNDRKGNYRGEEFCRSVAYLCHLCYEGARERYGENLSQEQSERIVFELKTICRMGFPDYFLIVQDYIAASRVQGYMVGPGRGSAAGSVVAYCLKITNLDPIRYQLLFERFLNPDRISMPDIDVDFENLQAAHEYVEKKYHPDHVSRVITFGTMAAKSAIKDVARISHLTIEESNRLSRMVPDRLSERVEKEYPFNPKFDQLKPGFKQFEKEVEIDDTDNEGQKITVTKTFQKGMEEVEVKINLKNCFRLVPEMKEELENGPEINREVLNFASQLEGSIRQVGMHACATIIGRGNLTDYIPICLSRDPDTGEEMWTSQYDGHYIEDVGMLKMDFLGLITLSIIHETLNNIKRRHALDIDIEAIPIDDKLTYELYSRGDTTVIFQFESPGMKKWLQKLHPERFEDLIAMNALYRPGPMDYIPDFVERKLGTQAIVYDLPEMEEFLSDTYGVTVYQEQVMLLSQKLAGFTKGEADKLRKAMGKKQIDILNSLKDKFMEGGRKNGHPEKVLDKIWKDWEKFAQYAFNKSHATCYAWVSYQTAWLKSHYPSEFFAANLSCNLSKADEIKKIMEDCKLHKISLLSPDVNESESHFTVNKQGHIRFGLGGIKGFGFNMVEAILAERSKNGDYADVYDLVERVPINNKALESLVYAGALDSFGYKRSQFFLPCKGGNLFIEDLVHYADLFRRDCMDNSVSLFGDAEELKPVRPEMPEMPGEEDVMFLLQKEKELVGMYLSGHPLDKYEFEMKTYTNVALAGLSQEIEKCEREGTLKKVRMGGMVTDASYRTTKSGANGKVAMIEDFTGVYELALFGQRNEQFMAYLEKGNFIFMEGEIGPRYMPKREEIAEGKKIPYSLKLKNVAFLGNVNESLLDSICLQIDTKQLSKDFRKNLVELLKTHKGGTTLLLTLTDGGSAWIINFISKKYNINVNKSLLDTFKEMGIQYSIKHK